MFSKYLINARRRNVAPDHKKRKEKEWPAYTQKRLKNDEPVYQVLGPAAVGRIQIKR